MDINHYQKILDSISTLIVEIDRNGKCKNVIQSNTNLFDDLKHYCELNSDHDLINNYVVNLADKELLIKKIKEIKQNDQQLLRYIEIKCKSNNKRLFFNILINVSKYDDNVLYLSLNDITNYINDNTNEVINRKQFLHCLEYAKIINLVLQDHKVVYYNSNVKNLFGYNDDEIYCDDFLNILIDPRDQDFTRELREKRYAGEFQEETGNINITHKSGMTLNADFISYGVMWNNRPASLVFLWDVSEQKRLKQNEIHYRYIFEQTPRAIEICTRDGMIIDMNPAAEMLWNVTRQETINKVNIFELDRISQNSKLVETIHDAIFYQKTTHLFDYKTYIENLENRIIRWLSTTVYPVVNEKKEVTHFVILNDDLTLKKEQEETRDLLYSDTLYKNRIFNCLTTISGELLECNNEETKLDEVIQHVGEIIDVSRAYIFYVRAVKDSNPLDYKMFYKFEWCNSNIPPQIENPFLNDVTFREIGFIRWQYLLLSNQSVEFASIDQIPKDERKLMQQQGIKSLLVLPIFSPATKLFGFIGFDSCRKERYWRSFEIDLLRNLSNMIGAFIKQCKYHRRLEKFMYDQEVILNNMDQYVWFFRDVKTYGFICDEYYTEFISTEKPKTRFRDDCLIEECHLFEDCEIHLRTNSQVFKTKEPVSFDMWTKNLSGKEKLLRVKKIPVIDKYNQKVKYIVCTAKDITEEYSKEKIKYDEYSKELEQKNEIILNTIKQVQDTITQTNKLLSIQ